jgi:hypothetical protein
MRNGIVIIGLCFAVTLAVIVGNRLSNEAMAVVVGALCGISASIPVSVGLVIAASRNWGRDEVPDESSTRRHLDPYPYRQPQPPVIVISPPAQNASPYQYPGSPYYIPPPMDDAPYNGRAFKIIGEE